jgi:hypothetical protein
MKTKPQVRNNKVLFKLRSIVVLILSLFTLVSCSFQTLKIPGLSSNIPSPFLPPTLAAPAVVMSSTPTLAILSTLSVTSPRITPTLTCLNNLTFEDDVTLPDGTKVSPKSILDKRWLVKNSGSCNWDSSYQLKLINGEALGVTPVQDLFPARAGSAVIIHLVFTAPSESGSVHSSWQAFDPDGNPFGDLIYLDIIVS